ncbi:MAG TPA: saccharopine dehydrogenase NADP-binding domain-containing protein [Solirubrobacterales bacterium]
MPARDLDVVVFGASSVTGRRVAAYLAERAPEAGAAWAAAGRDPAKIERVLAEEGAAAPETIAADVGDPESLAALAARAKVVLNLVGPYTLHGRPVIDACVAGGASYVDLTGEIPFVRRVIAEVDAAAGKAGVKVVQVCGFEALPPDLAVQLAAEAAADRFGEALADVDLLVSTDALPMPPRPSDMVSGGTLQSVAAAASDEDAAVISDPACLVDDPALATAIRRASPLSVVPRRGPGGVVVAPIAPAGFINPPVIQRSHALRVAATNGSPEPAAFRYREGIAIDGPAFTLPLRFAAAGMLSAPQLGFLRLAEASPGVRQRIGAGLERILPSSGFGPATDRIERWRWRMSLVAKTSGGHELSVEVRGKGHPGYLTTARVLGEAGLLLAEQGATPKGSGCLTPAAAIGTAEIDRFARAGLEFELAG